MIKFCEKKLKFYITIYDVFIIKETGKRKQGDVKWRIAKCSLSLSR